jgi:hypothetical protein
MKGIVIMLLILFAAAIIGDLVHKAIACDCPCKEVPLSEREGVQLKHNPRQDDDDLIDSFYYKDSVYVFYRTIDTVYSSKHISKKKS